MEDIELILNMGIENLLIMKKSSGLKFYYQFYDMMTFQSLRDIERKERSEKELQKLPVIFQKILPLLYQHIKSLFSSQQRHL